MAREILTLSVFQDDVVRAEVFTVDGGKPTVRIICIDSGEVLPTFPVFKNLEAAEAYARRCVR